MTYGLSYHIKQVMLSFGRLFGYIVGRISNLFR